MDTKEEFCGLCLAIPLSLIGVGTAGIGATKGGYSRNKKIMLYGGIILTVLSLLVAILYLAKCKTCR